MKSNNHMKYVDTIIHKALHGKTRKERNENLYDLVDDMRDAIYGNVTIEESAETILMNIKHTLTQYRAKLQTNLDAIPMERMAVDKP